MKLHLGCGQCILDEYINIDFPQSEHTVQKQNRADINQDITTLNYKGGTIEEVRLHHVFEHFTRPVACALVACWQSWLQPGGMLRIEVPDLVRSAITILNPISTQKEKSIAERHLFGSHEADWAVHCVGYSKAHLIGLIEGFGFKVDSVHKFSWKGTHNIDIVSIKDRAYSKVESRKIAEKYLSMFMVDESQSEKSMLAVWLNIYDQQIEKGWGNLSIPFEK